MTPLNMKQAVYLTQPVYVILFIPCVIKNTCTESETGVDGIGLCESSVTGTALTRKCFEWNWNCILI